MDVLKKVRGINCQLSFNHNSKVVWNVISAPNHLNLFHPFCKNNSIISWEESSHVDMLEYLNGLKYIRKFTKWSPLKGYELKIGKKDEKQSYVVWEIKEIDNTTCTLSITVYPHLLSKFPKIISYLPFKLIIKPKLYNYLFSVISGLKYYLENNEKVPKNNFGKHKWFS
tara:strand:+ start:6175 stop:6681 length:507 start_codon:yes stop_codon:yes gene_type:complete